MTLKRSVIGTTRVDARGGAEAQLPYSIKKELRSIRKQVNKWLFLAKEYHQTFGVDKRVKFKEWLGGIK